MCKLNLNYRVHNMKYNETFNAYGEEVVQENGCIYIQNTDVRVKSTTALNVIKCSISTEEQTLTIIIYISITNFS